MSDEQSPSAWSSEGEFRGGDRRTGLISGVVFVRTPVVYSEVDGMAVFEGDIVLGTVEQLELDLERARSRASSGQDIQESVGITGSRFRWPDARVPFEIDPALPGQQRVRDAIAHWETNVGVDFVERTPANASQFPNWVRFTDAGGCFSFVGMQPSGEQTLSLGTGCTTGNAIHEIGHAVGLWHEQSREDRDLFVTIHFANIQPGMEHNFDQHISDGDDLGRYDYGSIMHYPRTAFSRNGQATITPVDPAAQIGQRSGLSSGDVAGVLQMYSPLRRWEVGWVTSLYRSLLSRAPDQGGLDHWVGLRMSGASHKAVIDGFLRSEEYCTALVTSLYRRLLDREPDQAGLGFWVAQLAAGTPLHDVQIAFLDSAEFKAVHPPADLFVEALYAKVLGRPSDPDGKKHWIDELAAGRSTTDVVRGFLFSQEYCTDQVTRLYNDLLGRAPDAAGLSHWVGLMSNGAPLQDIQYGFLASLEYRVIAITGPTP
jgi:Astacin (Peptidase family M12A)/Domain of unknown function (DUF4214)